MATQRFPEKYADLPKISVVGKSDISTKSILAFLYSLGFILFAFPLFTAGSGWNFRLSGGGLVYFGIIYNVFFTSGTYSVVIDCITVIFMLTVINLAICIFSKLGRFYFSMVSAAVCLVLLLPPYFLVNQFFRSAGYSFQGGSITYFYIALFLLFVVIFFQARKGHLRKALADK